MQALGAVTNAQLLAAGQQPLMKLEIYDNGDWVNPWIDIGDAPTERSRIVLTDGALEEWTDAEDLTNWTEQDGGGVNEGIFREAVTVHGGTYSARMLTTAGGDYAAFYQDFTLTPGNACILSLWYIKGAHASSDLRVYLYDTGSNVSLKSDGTWQAGVLPILMTDSAVWKLFELEFTVHASYSNYRLRFYKSHGAGGAISYYIDDVSLIETMELDVNGGGGGSEQVRNYLESANVSLGGASMTPNPVEGTWGATLFNEDSIFHPQHPTSSYKDWFVTERLTRLSIGATYGGVDYYWQRVIGYMNVPKFSAPDYRVNISGGDYMKRLRETELRSPNNYWGLSATFNSIDSDGVIGAELYAEADAMEIGAGEANNVANWVATNCNFASLNDGGDPNQPSGFVGNSTAQTPPGSYVANANVGVAVAGTQYKVSFEHRVIGATGVFLIRAEIWQAAARIKYETYYPTDTWTEESFYFTATANGAIEMRFAFSTGFDCRLDQISIKEYEPPADRYYQLPAASKGPYHVTLDGNPVWQGEEDEGWWHEEATRRVFFDLNKTVANGVANLIVYYFTVQVPENVVADILVTAGLYADQAAALAAMDFDATGVTIDKVWFDAGTTCLNAIKKICERCDYRFYLRYDGIPVFKSKAVAGAADFTFTDPKQIASINTYQDQNEIKNRIIIWGMKQSEPTGYEDSIPPELKGETSDATSITAYGERTLTIRNHLFQTQAVIDAMCATLLAEYKDPKWYANLRMPFNPVPLELGDNIQWEERLSPTLNITQTGIIRDIKIDNFNTTYKCVHT